MIARVKFELAGKAHYPTVGGGTLEVSGDELNGEMSLRFEFRDPEEMLPRDVVACDLRIADHKGRVWQATSRFTTELFVTHMFDFSALQHMDLFTAKRAEERWIKAFESNTVLEDARFGADDRFYRTLLVNGKRRQVQFKYTVLNFDVAVNQNPEGSYSTNFAVRIRRGSFWDEGDTLPEMGYFLSSRHLLRNNTALFDPKRKFWVDTPIPMALVFEKTEASGSAQKGVRLVEQ